MDGELPVVSENPLRRARRAGSHALSAPPRALGWRGMRARRRALRKAARRTLRKRLGSALAGIGALAAKFATYVKGAVLLLPKLKLLTTAGTALVSVAAYSLFWGWQFAAGFVVLLFVHEMGHVIQLRREGIKASTPMFIPFLGAAIFSRSLGDNALAEARVGLAGPVLGTLGAAAVAVVGSAHRQRPAACARLCRLPHQPLQPAAGRAARRRPRDGRDGTLDVVRGLRRAVRSRCSCTEASIRSC